MQRGIDNLVRLVGETGCQVIVDHHAVREPRFRERLAQAFDTGRVVTAAEYLGRRQRMPRGMAGRALGPAPARRGRTRARPPAAREAVRSRGEEGGDPCRRCRRWARSAPDIRLQGIGGKEWNLAEQRGRSVVLLFYVLDWTPG